jgi:hypothetical protein
MQVYTQCKLLAAENSNFNDDQGHEVKYFRYYLKDNEGSVIVVGSSADFTDNESDEGMAVLNVRGREGGGFKVSIVDFKKGGTIEF